jgi:hypothetical protein
MEQIRRKLPLPAVLRIRNVYPGSQILIFTHFGSRIPDPKTSTKERGEKKLVVKPFFVATNLTKLKLFYFTNAEEFGNLGQFSKNLAKNLSLSSTKYGVGIRDPRSGKNLFRFPDPGPGVNKASDPVSGSATLASGKLVNAK